MDVSPLHRFLEKVVGVLGHDLRSPLGAVINYASLLEDDDAPAVDDVHDVAGRIRTRATEAAEMATLTADALLLVAQGPSPVRCDPAVLLRSIGRELDPNFVVRRRTRGSGDVPVDMAIEPAVVGFVWGAFLRLDRHARSTVPWDLQLRAVVQGMEATLEVGLDEALDAQLPVVALDQFVRSAVGKVVPSRRLALELAGEIIHCRGGVLELFGSLGKSAGIRLRMPQTSG